MSEMKAALLYGDRDLRVADIQKPAAGDNGVVIDVKAVGVCGTDLHAYKMGLFKEMSIPQADGSVLFGHEFSGDVVEMGPNTGLDDIKVGDRVTGMALGAYAEYCTVTPIITENPLVLKLPDNVSYDEAATIEPLVVSLSSVQRANLQPGEKVLITGAGMIGLGCVQVIRALYPEVEVIISDVADNRLAIARKSGAHRTINAMEEDVVASMKEYTGEAPVMYNPSTTGHIDVVIECSGLNIPLNQALEVVKPITGRLVVVALYEEKLQIDLNQVVSKNLQVIGTLGYTEDQIKQCIQLISEGKVDRKPLITHTYALTEAPSAFEAQINTGETLKAVIHP